MVTDVNNRIVPDIRQFSLAGQAVNRNGGQCPVMPEMMLLACGGVAHFVISH